jgi:fructose-1,6-bisphosphatase-3
MGGPMEQSYEQKYLLQLAKEFPTVQEVSTELINLTAILNLPKGTEHFLSDIHGEYETFNHFLKNGSGVIMDKIAILFPEKTIEEHNRLAFFVYYPKQMTKKYQHIMDEKEYKDFLKDILSQLIELAQLMSQKYTKSKIRKSLPPSFSYIIQELLYENSKDVDKEQYYSAIISSIFKTKREKNFLIELSYLIQKLTIDRLHIVGDIFDRGPSAHLVMNKMMKYHSLDIEWGNHDIIWMGAASGSKLSICNVIRNSAKYNTLDTLEEGYGINLLPLAQLALKHYQNDPCNSFLPNKLEYSSDQDKSRLVSKMHKAISIIQFKLEGIVFKRNPNFELDDRMLLDKIDYKNNTITINEKTYQLNDTLFPTINPDDPYSLTEDEENVINHLKNAFLNNDLLQTHIRFLFQYGYMHLVYNKNLLFHGCIPLDKNGEFTGITIDENEYTGKALFTILDKKIRSAYLNRYQKNNNDKDYFVFLWQGAKSPLFGKSAMKTFERHLINDKTTHKEQMNYFFALRDDKEVLKKIYKEFDIDFHKSKIINGHVPTDITAGGRPIMADNRLYTIDGGMSKQYQSKIRIGGYTLVSDSYKIFLISHERFVSVEDLIEKEEDIISTIQEEELNVKRAYMYNTDKGQRIQAEIDDLYLLLEAYRSGTIKENPRIQTENKFI